MFEIKPWDAAAYRQQTRRSTLIIAVVFLALAMLLSTLAVMLFGTPGVIIFVSTWAGYSLRCW